MEHNHAATNSAPSSWSLDSWRSKPIKQHADYPDKQKLVRSLKELSRLPPIVHPGEIEMLKKDLKDVAEGKALLLQGGDCAELFAYCEKDSIEAKLKLLLQMSLVLVWGADRRVVRIGRMAGQYAKPRSSPTEMVDGKKIPSFRGDILNGFELNERELDSQRLVSAYNHSVATLNYIRCSIKSGIADLRRPMDWSLGHVKDEALKAKYSVPVQFLKDMLSFVHTIDADRTDKLNTIDFYTSHEGLVLEYEQSLTRLMEAYGDFNKGQKYYDTSAHFLWIGDRTRQIDGAHVEFFRGIANPIGVKIGPTTPTEDLLRLLRTLNPSREVGKITLITRYGVSKVASMLPPHIRAVEDSEYRRTVVWQCDPMHGNTRTTDQGIKTRNFQDIFGELQETLKIHMENASSFGGLHLELTGEAVTECVGGSENLAESDLSTNYTSFCDPRLNEKQALELAFLVADHVRKMRKVGTV